MSGKTIEELSTGDYVDFAMTVEDCCRAAEKVRTAIADRDLHRLDLFDKIQQLGLSPNEMHVVFQGSGQTFVVKWHEDNVNIEPVKVWLVLEQEPLASSD